MSTALKKGSYALLLCVLLTMICYQFVDRTVAFWSYQQQFQRFIFLKWFTYIPPVILFATGIGYVIFVMKFCLDKISQRDHLWLAVMNSVAIAYFLHDLLKSVFGRYWPKTWVCNNLSLIQNNAYGFNWWHGGQAYASFPSGHTTTVFAAMIALWMLDSRWRWLAAIFAALVIIGLLGMDYHFVSDIIAGAFLGGLTAFYTVTFMQRINQIESGH